MCRAIIGQGGGALGTLDSNGPKPVIVRFAKGDMTVPNPTSSALIRAGGLKDRAIYFRNDLAFAANAATPKKPHTFLTNIAAGGLGPSLAIGAPTQIAPSSSAEARR